MMQTTTPVPVEGGIEGGALPKSAGTSFQGRRKPNGSACQRRTMAGVQDEAKHAMSAMSPLKSENRELSDYPGSVAPRCLGQHRAPSGGS